MTGERSGGFGERSRGVDLIFIYSLIFMKGFDFTTPNY
jgi:hypothetical protein